MSVSLSDWLRPLLLLSQDDRENAEILAEYSLSQLADAYAFIYQSWQDKTASKLLTSIQVIAALDRLHWLETAESDAWLSLFAQRLQQACPSAQALLEELETTGYPQVRLQKLQAADLSNWSEDLDIPWVAKPDRVVLPPELKVRSTPLGYALAVRSSSFVLYKQPLNSSDYLRERFWPDVQETLNSYWQVYTASDCLQLIYWLGGQGQRYAWQLDFAWLKNSDAEDRQTWREELPEGFEGYADLMEELALEDKLELDVAAWDWVRMADLALAGYLAGYLTSSQWRSFALVALWLLRSRYGSWEELADSYLLGYRFWQTQTDFSLSPELEVTWQQLLTLPFSPLQQLDWQALSLDHPDFRDAINYYSERLDDPLMLASLLASLRDDVSLLTGLALDDLPESRRSEAKDYLFAGLDIHPDEQLTTTLARFWQPGRVHHYDQLALNCRVGKIPQLPSNLAAVDEVWEAWREQTPLLAELVKHPAGIVMAEKYAFYLVKALETNHYSVKEAEQLALALKDYLSWHYSSAQGLLQAWQGWDEVLSLSGEERPLLAELNWHLQDPGSLFRFLPWKRPPARFTEPGKPVSEADLATLNLVGPLTGLHWSWPEKLPQHPRQELKSLLQDTHLFQDADDLKDFLNHLLLAGDRQEYMIAFSPFTLNSERLDMEIEAQEQDDRDEEQEAYYQRLLRVKNNALGINDLDLTAWDMVQLVDLAVAGYQLDWLSEKELQEWLAKIRQQITQEYTGWADFARALLAGYNFFMNETENRAELLEVFSQRLLSLLIAVPAQAGLWYTLAWPGDKQRSWNQSATPSLSGKQRLH
ncbi:YbeU/YbeR family protein [Marinospirillum sp.]|uniref:YbeU/YbeR family protein n=1 Tax=Marinospirillum sp. TaxID=2183934 RepID=UPI0028704A2F|nr:YbeU/YbeR family protein [Marinospirillum sp.]MDR9469201.1 YbeU/YbeR family protein [Marinospirillum sp.]